MTNIIKKPLALEIAQEIRRAGGEVWLVQKTEAGLLFRFSLDSRQGRVLLRSPVNPSGSVIPEKNSRFYQADTVQGLRQWLTKP